MEQKVFRKDTSFLKDNYIYFALIVVVAIFSAASGSFLSLANITTILRQVSILGIMSCGLTFIIIAGKFDVSIGANLSFVLTTIITVAYFTTPLYGMIAGLAGGMLIGAINGYLVGYMGLSPMITTMGMQTILRGVTLLVTGGQFHNIEGPQVEWFKAFGQSEIASIPTQFIMYIAFIAIFQLILTKTLYGRRLSAVGGNPVSSRFSGIKDKRTVFFAYIIMGLCVAIAGIIQASRSLAAQTNMGEGMELDVITAVVLGGTSLLGGEGNVVKTFVGVLIIGCMKNGFIMAGLPYYFQWLAQSVIIIVVVWVDLATKRGKVLQ